MKIQINIFTTEDGKARAVLEPPKPLDSFATVTKEEDHICKILWMKIDELLFELKKVSDDNSN